MIGNDPHPCIYTITSLYSDCIKLYILVSASTCLEVDGYFWNYSLSFMEFIYQHLRLSKTISIFIILFIGIYASTSLKK